MPSARRVIHATRDWNTVSTFYEDPNSRHKLCSVYPVEFVFHDHNGMRLLPAKSEGEPYSFVEIPPAWEREDKGDGKCKNDLNIAAEDVARAMVKDHRLEKRGVFVPKGKDPTAAEIQAATRARDAYWLSTDIPNADGLWSRTQDPKRIDDNAKMAARILGLSRPWAVEVVPVDTAPCPVCKTPIKQGVLKCVSPPGCGEFMKWNMNLPVWVKKADAA